MIIYSGWVVWGEADVGRMMRSIEAYEHKDNGYEVLDMMVFFFFFLDTVGWILVSVGY